MFLKLNFMLVGQTKDYCFSNIGDEVVHPLKTVKDLDNYVFGNLKWSVPILRRLGLCFSPDITQKKSMSVLTSSKEVNNLTMYKSFFLSTLRI